MPSPDAVTNNVTGSAAAVLPASATPSRRLFSSFRKYSPSSTEVDGLPAAGTSLPTSSEPSPTQRCRSHGPFSPSGSRVDPCEMAVARSDPFRPPALVPAMTSTTTLALLAAAMAELLPAGREHFVVRLRVRACLHPRTPV